MVGLYGVLDPSRFDGHGVLTQAADTNVRYSDSSAERTRRSHRSRSTSSSRRSSSAGVEHEIHVYPGAPHSFFDRKQEEFAEESEDAWRRILGFLAGLREGAAG